MKVQVSDGSLTAEATITITINAPVNDVSRYSVNGQNKYVLISIEDKNTAIKDLIKDYASNNNLVFITVSPKFPWP